MVRPRKKDTPLRRYWREAKRRQRKRKEEEKRKKQTTSISDEKNECELLNK